MLTTARQPRKTTSFPCLTRSLWQVTSRRSRHHNDRTVRYMVRTLLRGGGHASPTSPRRNLHPQLPPHPLQRLLPPPLVPHTHQGLPRAPSRPYSPRDVRVRQHLPTPSSPSLPDLLRMFAPAGGDDRGSGLSALKGQRSKHCSKGANGESRLHEFEPFECQFSLHGWGQTAEHVPQVVDLAISVVRCGAGGSHAFLERCSAATDLSLYGCRAPWTFWVL